MSDKEGDKKQINAAEKLKEFLDKENILFIPNPQFRARDDGTFSVIVSVAVEYKKTEKQGDKK